MLPVSSESVFVNLKLTGGDEKKSISLMTCENTKYEVENGVVNVDRDQFTILCPIILSTGAPF